MNAKLPYLLKRKQSIALTVFGFLILIGQLTFSYYKDHSTSNFPKVSFFKEKKSAILLSKFNPNELDEKQWKNLGFSEKQAKTILKYKEVVGGIFTSKEQLKKCYSISEEKYLEIAPFILLPETNSSQNFNQNSYVKSEKKLNISGKFNPDLYTEIDWQKLGFSQKQAFAIIKYKNYLGGSFISKEKLKECFIINDENYRKLSPYLILPEKTPENFVQKNKFLSKGNSKTSYFDFDPNLLNIEGWQKLGFSEKQAAVIVNYRDKNLKGSFKSLEDLQKCFVISEEKFKEIRPFIKLSIPITSVANKETIKPISKTDFAKTDLNKITYNQLLEFGFDEKSAASFLGYRKKLGGFMNKNQILETYNIDKNFAEKLIDTSPLSSANIEKQSLLEAPEEWLQNHPYFRYYANRIVFLRVTYPSEKEIFKKLKAKPEDMAKMKLYLK